MASVLGALLVYFKIGHFELNWKEMILLSLKKGGSFRLSSWSGAMDKSEDTRSKGSKKPNQ